MIAFRRKKRGGGNRHISFLYFCISFSVPEVEMTIFIFCGCALNEMICNMIQLQTKSFMKLEVPKTRPHTLPIIHNGMN